MNPFCPSPSPIAHRMPSRPSSPATANNNSGTRLAGGSDGGCVHAHERGRGVLLAHRPTDEELLTHYLALKAADAGFTPAAVCDVEWTTSTGREKEVRDSDVGCGEGGGDGEGEAGSEAGRWSMSGVEAETWSTARRTARQRRGVESEGKGSPGGAKREAGEGAARTEEEDDGGGR
ncbi:hypothetical protein C2845_PM03G04570 [Panicum miliaceum]|uniref:NAC domain-containing protein n=1 Tax=Panicum miliaceum TaxID=4540 RepID=A0A3L6T5V8_PANMI|nr:hypothetical protein C2845_PM03G04570 [Panicum miliaceum]